MMTLRDAVDRLFDDAFTHPWTLNESWQGSGGLSVDTYETENEVVVKAAVPGLKADDVEIQVTGEMLTIKGQTKENAEIKDKAYHIREHRCASFERSIGPPTLVVSEKARAEFEDGVLTVTRPKAEEVKPKTITVMAK
jgi:HSP20 family protein